ncbi:MAG: hypothetical protein IJR84_02095 [Bacteroidaceae bacterium]|nr:hypothetical protein [Bacteroidaceae bacterium]
MNIPGIKNAYNLIQQIGSKKTVPTGKETLLDIGKSIQNRRDKEFRLSIPQIGVARALCSIISDRYPRRDHIIWLTNAECTPFQSSADREIVVSKNTKVGGAIITGVKGRHHYVGPGGLKFDIDIFNFSSYTPEQGAGAKGITIQYDGDNNIYKYQTLYDLLISEQFLKESLEEEEKKKKQLEEERIRMQKEEETAREAARKAAEAERQRLEEEARRLEELRLKKEEEERQKAEEIERLEASYQQAKLRAITFRNFIRNESSLRSQHILDPSQEEAKRSHLYDGVPLVIEGGPGTGKTTTMIQRLKFLLDKDALNDYESPLTQRQINELTDYLSDKWLFFSPSPLLLRFLMNNMNAEGLSAVEGKNIITIDDFRQSMLSTYHLYNMDTNGPFRSYKQSAGKTLILQPEVAIKEFEQFCVKNSVGILLAAANLNTSRFSWHKDSFGIKAICLHAEKVKDIEALMRLFNSLQDHESKGVYAKENRLAELVRRTALSVQTSILEDEKTKTEIHAIFMKWEEERIAELTEVEEDEMDESNEEENTEEVIMLDFEPRLFNFLKGLLKRLAVSKIDTNKKLSSRQKLIYEKIEPLMEDINLREIGELEFFSKRYAFLCKGIESNLINQIPRLYKVYRKKLLADEKTSYYNLMLLKTLVEKDNNKHLHYDEQNLLIGFINNLAIYIRKRSKERYDRMVKRNKYIRAYDENKKPVIGIDEATDYTVMDYYLMYSFRHHEYAAVTLCGDIMQGLLKNGIKDWSELKQVLPNLEVCDLKVSYRQIPTLVKMAKDIYFAERGEMPPYDSRDEMVEGEPQPLAFVSDDEDEKMEWIVKRLREVYLAYDRAIPSVAIFIPNNRSVDGFVKRLSEQDGLDEIKVSAGKETNIIKAVKVYELSEVKGMEFEVAIFYDLDEALKGEDKELMKRHLYVGISRASSHLAAIFNQEEGNEELLGYFARDVHNWKM